MRVGRALVAFLAPAAACVLVTACASSKVPTRVQAFADATTLTATNVADALTAVENSFVAVRLDQAALDFDRRGLDAREVASWHFLSDEDRKARLDILKALERYAGNLAALAGGTRFAAFDEATRSLGESLGQVNDDLVRQRLLSHAPASDEDLRLFTTAINALGHWLIEGASARSVREQVHAMQEPVARICDLLVLDLGAPAEPGKAGSGLRLQLWNQYDQALEQQDLFLRHNLERLDPVVRRSEIRALATMATEQRRADAALAATQDAVRGLARAHGQLAAAVDGQAVEFDAVIGTLLAEGERIKAFYGSLAAGH